MEENRFGWQVAPPMSGADVDRPVVTDQPGLALLPGAVPEAGDLHLETRSPDDGRTVLLAFSSHVALVASTQARGFRCRVRSGMGWLCRQGST